LGLDYEGASDIDRRWGTQTQELGPSHSSIKNWLETALVRITIECSPQSVAGFVTIQPEHIAG
jgi:hypothetical protein